MTPPRLLAAALLTAVLLLSFYVLPGHAYLTSDTQIYAPILENLRNPSLFGNDLLTEHPHVRFTIYDEVTNGLRAFGLPLQSALVLQQIIWRFLGLIGVFLVSRRLGLTTVLSVFVTATFALSAFVAGPAVYTIEVEPVPRGFAIGLLLFALGCLAWDRWWLAAAAAGMAFLYHPPVALPFLAIHFVYLITDRTRLSSPARRTWMVFPAAALLLIAAAAFQPGRHEPQELLAQVPPAWEKLQKMRASYNWISLWSPHFFWQYPLLTALNVAAWLRLRSRMPRTLSYFALGLPLWGLLSIPISYCLLDVLKWSLMPQWQPARAALFCTAGAVLFGTIAAVQAVQERRYWAMPLWMVVVYGLTMNTDLPEFITGWEYDHIRLRAYLTVGLASIATLGVWLAVRAQVWGSAVCLAVAALAFWVFPVWGRVRNYPFLETPAVTQLASWAASHTPDKAVFLFPKAKENQIPGVFRERALRAVYVDWKAGGQVNFSRAFTETWWSRWQQTMASATLRPLSDYQQLGVDYIILPAKDSVPEGKSPLYSNQQFAVYDTARVSTSPRSGMED